MGSINPVYFDTNIYIYYLENHPQFGNLAEKAIYSAIDRHSPIITSTLLITELLVAPIKQKRFDLIELYTHLEAFLPGLIIHPITQPISILAATLRAENNLTTPDALHLATAINHQVATFVTTDQHLAKIKGIPLRLIAIDRGQ